MIPYLKRYVDVDILISGKLQELNFDDDVLYDFTGYALYANNDGQNFIMRFKVGENVGEGSTSVNEDVSVYNERKKLVDKNLSELGATTF